MSSSDVKEDPEEPPAFKDGFDDYGIALHFVLPRPPDVSRFTPLDGSDVHFRSFERDLLSHVYRDDPGFECRVIELPAEYKSVTLHIPKVLKYVSESEHRELTQLDETLDHGTDVRTRSLSMRASLTQFRSGVAILHIVFNPATLSREPAEDKRSLSEYDFMKLTKLWEGGESVGKGEPNDIHGKLTFSLAGSKDTVELVELVRAVIDINNTVNADKKKNLIEIEDEALGKLPPRAGTIEIVVGDGNHRNLFDVLVKLASKDPTEILQAHRKVAGSKNLENQLVYVQGILCGLLDFNIDADEFNDVFDAPLAVDLTQLLDMHKGTLLKFITKDRAFESAYSTIGISPYLLLPQSILLHNEELLKFAVSKASGADGRQFEDQLREAELAMRKVLQRELLPNVFQYSTEIDLHDDGHKSRGLTNLQYSLEQRLKEIDGRLEELVSKKETALAFWLAIFGVVLALGQLVSGWEAIANLISPWLGLKVNDSRTFVGNRVVPALFLIIPIVFYLIHGRIRRRRG